jgi:hypothetical protein
MSWKSTSPGPFKADKQLVDKTKFWEIWTPSKDLLTQNW